MKIIKDKDIDKAIVHYNTYERRATFFDLSRKLIEKELNIAGYILLLAIWNFASFRYVTKTFDLSGFEKTMKNLEIYFKVFKKRNIDSISYKLFTNEITIIFNNLSNIQGIGYTGASKLMHLINPNVFIMWDSYIRGEKSGRFYENCTSYYRKKKDEKNNVKKYKKTSEGYIEFLCDMKLLFENNNLKRDGILPTKIIDVFNYVNITLPIQKKEKEEKELKKKLKQNLKDADTP